jgi:23S rRNA (guanosine2251-2'-O)-methyltransferase
VVFGVRPVEEICRARPRDVAVVYLADGARSPEHLAAVAAAKDRGITVELRPRAFVARFADRGAVHQGLVALVGEYHYSHVADILAEATAGPAAPLLVLLDGVTDPHNLGAVVRSAEVMGAHGVVIPEHGAAPVAAGAVKASAGATERMRIARVGNLLRTIDELRRREIRVYGSAPDRGEILSSIDLRRGVAWVVGSEGRGLREAVARRCDGVARIPQAGEVGSLNVSAAGAILLYETARQRASAAPA